MVKKKASIESKELLCLDCRMAQRTPGITLHKRCLEDNQLKFFNEKACKKFEPKEP